MSLLSDFYIASPEKAIRYDNERNLPASEHAEFNGLTYDEVANLWAVLENAEPTPGHAAAFECVLMVEGGQRLIHRFPPEFVALLAALDAAGVTDAAAKWVQAGEMAYMGCQPADVEPMVEALSGLARAAQQTGKSLYLWMCV